MRLRKCHVNKIKKKVSPESFISGDKREDPAFVVKGDLEKASCHRSERKSSSDVGTVDEGGVDEGGVRVLDVLTLLASRAGWNS